MGGGGRGGGKGEQLKGALKQITRITTYYMLILILCSIHLKNNRYKNTIPNNTI